MDLQIVGKNMSVSDNIRSHIEQKMLKLERHFPQALQGVIEISRETTKSPDDRFVAQITLTHSGTILRGEEKSSDVFAAISMAIDVVDRRVNRYKGILQSKKGRKPAAPPAEKELSALIVREKLFVLETLSPEEAVERIELIGHDFFLFINQLTQRFSLLYRRQDGSYGLIECKVA